MKRHFREAFSEDGSSSPIPPMKWTKVGPGWEKPRDTWPWERPPPPPKETILCPPSSSSSEQTEEELEVLTLVTPGPRWVIGPSKCRSWGESLFWVREAPFYRIDPDSTMFPPHLLHLSSNLPPPPPPPLHLSSLFL